MRFCSSPGGLQELGMPRGVVALEAFLVLLVVEHKLSLQPVKKRCFGNDQVFFFFSPQVVLAFLALAAARSRQ